MKLHEVTQRKLEAYEKQAFVDTDEVRSVAKFNRIIVEAAVAAGIAEIDSKNVMDEPPYKIIQWTQEILAHVKAAKEPPSTGES